MNANRAIISSLDEHWQEHAPWFRFHMRSFISKPQWIAVVNADALDEVLEALEVAFRTTPMYTMSEAIERHNRFAAEAAARSEARRKREEEIKMEEQTARDQQAVEGGAEGSQEHDTDDTPF